MPLKRIAVILKDRGGRMKQTFYKRCKDHEGFTLLEVLIALTILSVSLLGLAAMSASVIRGNAFSDEMTIAANLAQDQMDRLLSLPFDTGNQRDVSASNNSANGGNLFDTAVTDYVENNVDDQGNVGGGTFTRIWNIEDNAATNTKTVVVIVSWTGKLGGIDITRNVTVSTLITGP